MKKDKDDFLFPKKKMYEEFKKTVKETDNQLKKKQARVGDYMIFLNTDKGLLVNYGSLNFYTRFFTLEAIKKSVENQIIEMALSFDSKEDINKKKKDYIQ